MGIFLRTRVEIDGVIVATTIRAGGCVKAGFGKEWCNECFGGIENGRCAGGICRLAVVGSLTTACQVRAECRRRGTCFPARAHSAAFLGASALDARSDHRAADRYRPAAHCVPDS